MDKLEEKLRLRLVELQQMRDQANMQLVAINTTIAEMENLLSADEEE